MALWLHKERATATLMPDIKPFYFSPSSIKPYPHRHPCIASIIQARARTNRMLLQALFERPRPDRAPRIKCHDRGTAWAQLPLAPEEKTARRPAQKNKRELLRGPLFQSYSEVWIGLVIRNQEVLLHALTKNQGFKSRNETTSSGLPVFRSPAQSLTNFQWLKIRKPPLNHLEEPTFFQRLHWGGGRGAVITQVPTFFGTGWPRKGATGATKNPAWVPTTKPPKRI